MKHKSELAAQLAKDLRAYASVFEPPALGLTHQYRLSRAQAKALQKLLDRAAFIVDCESDRLAKQEAPGTIQTDAERMSRSQRKRALDMARAL